MQKFSSSLCYSNLCYELCIVKYSLATTTRGDFKELNFYPLTRIILLYVRFQMFVLFQLFTRKYFFMQISFGWGCRKLFHRRHRFPHFSSMLFFLEKTFHTFKHHDDDGMVIAKAKCFLSILSLVSHRRNPFI